MEFKNLTPFDALAFEAADTQDREYHVVVMCVGYALRPRYPDAKRGDPRCEVFDAHALDSSPLPLCLADEHWGEAADTSLRRESDLVPYRPKCDVVVSGKVYGDQAQQLLQARLTVRQGKSTLVDKTLTATGPRILRRQSGLGAWLREGINPTRAYTLEAPTATSEVPLRYELAFGGASCVPHPQAGQADQPAYTLNEVCYRNPLGAGWMAQGYFEALRRASLELPETLRAPQIMWPHQPFKRLQHSPQAGAMDAAAMARVDYPMDVAGFGALCKAWAPRLALAGSCDADWQAHRHPLLPKDFDFAYWNGAPADQQIGFPDLTQGLTLQTEGLRPGGGGLQVTLPVHRAMALMRLNNGLVLPNPMQIDLIEWDNNDAGEVKLRLTLRTAVLKHVGVRALEARFETNSSKPALVLKPSEAYRKPSLQSLHEDRTADHGQVRSPHG